MRKTPWVCGLAGAVVLGVWPVSADMSAALTAEETSGFRRVVTLHLERYAAMEIQDLYKLVYQASMGSEHAVPDREAARQWLEREASTLTPRIEGEPATDPLPPEGELVRVHLRPFIDRGGDLDELLDAFVQTANDYPASTARLETYWDALEAMADSEELPFTRPQLAEYFAALREQGLPPVRHSTVFRDLYKPAYRVILLDGVPVRGTGVAGE